MTVRLYSAVVDPVGAFPMQAERLVHTLMGMAGVPAERIVLYVVDADNYHLVVSRVEQLGCHVVPISPFPGHKYCNKLQQLAPLLKRSFDEVVLLDCDIVVLEDLPAATDGVLAKPVGMPNPPLPVLEKLFDAAGLPLRIMPTDIHGEPTAWANANGGVYVLPRDVTEVL